MTFMCIFYIRSAENEQMPSLLVNYGVAVSVP